MKIPFQANGNIFPCRFVSMDPAAQGAGDNKVIEDIVAAQMIMGVSQEGTNYPPQDDPRVTVAGHAAIDGEPVLVHCLGDICLIELAGSVAAGDLLKANATTDGKAVKAPIDGTSTVPQFVGGQALQAGASGEKIKMMVMPFVYTYET